MRHKAFVIHHAHDCFICVINTPQDAEEKVSMSSVRRQQRTFHAVTLGEIAQEYAAMGRQYDEAVVVALVWEVVLAQGLQAD